MPGEVKQINERYSLDAWNQHATMEIILTDHLSVLVKTQDILAVIADETQNPLLTSIRAMMGEGESQGAMQNMLQNPDSLKQFTEAINKLMRDVIVSPPLKEQGHEDGVSLTQFTLDWKMKIFYAMVGGEDSLQQAETFRQGQTPRVVNRKTRRAIRATSK